MEKYKVQIRSRKNALSVVAAAMLLIYAGLVFYRGGLPDLPSFIKGFHTGAFIGVELCIVFFLARYIKAIKNEAELKKLYIEENDERNAVILQSASTLSLVVIFVGLGLATVISGFFNAVIFYTLLAALLSILIIFFALWIFFAKKI